MLISVELIVQRLQKNLWNLMERHFCLPIQIYRATKFQWIEFLVQSAGLTANFLDSILNHTIKRQMLKLIQMRQPPTETSRGRNPTDGNSTQYQKKRQRFLRQASKWISRTSPQRDSVCVTTIGDKNKVLSTSECAGEPSSSDRKSL